MGRRSKSLFVLALFIGLCHGAALDLSGFFDGQPDSAPKDEGQKEQRQFEELTQILNSNNIDLKQGNLFN